MEKKLTTLACINAKLNKADLMTKCHTFDAHVRGCAMLGLRLSGDDGKTRLKQTSDRDNVSKSKRRVRRIPQVFSTYFSTVSRESTFGDNTLKITFFPFFLNLADRDLTTYVDHSDTDVFLTMNNWSGQGEHDGSITSGARHRQSYCLTHRCSGFTVHCGWASE